MSRVLIFYRFIVVFLLMFFIILCLRSQASIDNLSQMFEVNKKSVMMVYTAKDTSISQGSAFLIDQNGLALSNFHVFENSDKAVVFDYEGKEYKDIKIIYTNPDLDFIIFKVNGMQLPPLKIASNQASIGEACFAIGNPLGLDQTLSTGIISGYRDTENYIQTSAEITHGSSGGPLFNSVGEVIGITTAGAGQANLNFAINILKIDLENKKKGLPDGPDLVVRKFLTYLDNGDFSSAYALSENPVWVKMGGLPWFQSKKSYGAIKSINIKEIKTESINSNEAVVFTHYYAEDPYNTSRYWEQNYFLEKKGNEWVIVKAKLK